MPGPNLSDEQLPHGLLLVPHTYTASFMPHRWHVDDYNYSVQENTKGDNKCILEVSCCSRESSTDPEKCLDQQDRYTGCPLPLFS